MEAIKFEWDESKNTINKKKHHVSFEEAKTVFIVMREEYDFSAVRRNPYAKKLKKQITINIDSDTIDYFRQESDNTGIPYQTLINLYLADCAKNKKKLQMTWG